MYLHVGSDYMVKNSEIIAVFNMHYPETEIYDTFMKHNKNTYKVVDATGGEGCYSFILTKDTIYLSSISSLTLKKRVDENFLIDGAYAVALE